MDQTKGLRRLLAAIAGTAIVLAIACLVWELLGFVQFCQSPPQEIETALTVLVAVTLVSSLVLARLTNKGRESAQQRTRNRPSLVRPR
ncbi:MAG: hypothetical protein ACRYG2_09560 [Janthinobacterium lividum]